ncbi:cyclodeaminase/cyclohydrolase family protein [Enterococcus gallinarum]|uniref:Cyclodeaminase/cyclohydrolase family protein n=1 Tax=Enterococcus gallinarum TaxID=1353 RepID=A0ABD4ZWA5_ENTGA|nr:cyclodeaminase/cyclohydrolase family protein [Enterococcus gallinarum]MBF0725550.1 cyclodeaminase/cyclohydrolase family protein [Enterococcus gallinarum]MDL4876372.1 cyclodeaminase/cyclohydrolase family protein [Enterococcus gallinarum]MDL4882874.1 cyclodeaminase/cyclohydrolase family protein [Enterococcus gallinarum]MDL4886420.1 cyclodeaminase/cyclohydrolase family protein [Enterococcus gallinarum]MDL4895074.1 cyclodeaminase/cyclohydrolase family protein [Enterococcus gallinarum]
MKLVEMQINDFIAVLGSDTPAPGGGSASALAAAQGIALTKMVTELTIGKKKYAEFEDEIELLQKKAKSLQEGLLRAIDEDTEAFNQVSAVFGLPKTTEEEKKARREAMQGALKGAAVTPFSMMEKIVDALKVTQAAVGKSNTNAASDLGVAALNLKAALQGAWLNVLINLASIKDEMFVRQYRKAGESLVEEGSKIADATYQQILESL